MMILRITIFTVILLILSVSIAALEYESKQNDTIVSISQSFMVPQIAIRSKNNSIDFENLEPGTKIIIPDTYVTNLVNNSLQTYIVEPDDTFFTVAVKFDTTVETLQNLNPHLRYQVKLPAGDVIIISKPRDVSVDDLITIKKETEEPKKTDEETTPEMEKHYIQLTAGLGCAVPVGFLNQKIYPGSFICTYVDFNKYHLYSIRPRIGLEFQSHKSIKSDNRKDYFYNIYTLSLGGNHKYYFKNKKLNKLNTTSSVLLDLNMMQFSLLEEDESKIFFLPGIEFQTGAEYLFDKNITAGLMLSYDLSFSKPEVVQNINISAMCSMGFF